MIAKQLHRLITDTNSRSFTIQRRICLILSLIFGLFYSYLELQEAFSGNYVVQDDARVYTFWLQKFIEPDILPNDVIAEYFASVTPWGFTAFFAFFAKLGIEPLLFSKILPIFLKIISISYWFFLSMEIFPVPIAGFISSLLYAQNLSLRDDLVSATPRSFIFVFFIAFLYYLSRRSLVPCLISIVLLGLFYPPFIFIVSGILILRLFRWQSGKINITQQRDDYILSLGGLVLAFVIMLPYAFTSSEFGPTISGEAARLSPGLAQTGRIRFFRDDLAMFWFFDQHSGLIPNVLEHAFNFFGLFLPLIFYYPHQFKLRQRLTQNVQILPQIIFSSLGMFLLAHLFLYKLFAPARYSRYTLKFVAIIAASIFIVSMMESILAWIIQNQKNQIYPQRLSTLFITVPVLILIIYPSFLANFTCTVYLRDNYGQMYTFLQKQPQDTLIASINPSTDNIPVFAKRSILIGWEYAVPYHVGYDQIITARGKDLIHAQYSPDIHQVKGFIDKYGVDYFVIDQDAFSREYILKNRWLQQWQDLAKEMSTQFQVMTQQGQQPVILQHLQRCTSLQVEQLLVVKAECVVEAGLKNTEYRS